MYMYIVLWAEPTGWLQPTEESHHDRGPPPGGRSFIHVHVPVCAYMYVGCACVLVISEMGKRVHLSQS